MPAMPVQHKRKLELMMTRDEAASFLAALAKGLESGSLAVGQSGLDIQGFKSLSVSFKSHPDGLYAKIKCKFPKPEGPCACPACTDPQVQGEGAPAAVCVKSGGKYGSLKKRMKSQFKSIMESLAQGVLPGLELVEAFAADGERMCAFPGKGDEFYPVYLEKNAAFLAAVQAGDVAAARLLAGELDQLKHDCHDRYK
ncbi:GAK system XXXCH domain-containing protein [Megalodesulfovibrio gigas]|nr:GAK system XXXCH domain-containing protein [Megalodesulfovibrio gigas]